MLLRCKHCDYKWSYEGKNVHYATCPKCRYKVRIPKEKVDDLHKKRLGNELKEKLASEKDTGKLIGVAGIVNNILKGYKYDESMLIQILLKIQSNFGWLPKEMLIEISKQLDLPLYQIHQVATFYKAFSLAPRGRHIIRVCMGTSCKVRGSQLIMDMLESSLGIKSGETTQDGKFTIETVNCIGCCALGPVILVDDEYHGNLRSSDLEQIISKYK